MKHIGVMTFLSLLLSGPLFGIELNKMERRALFEVTAKQQLMTLVKAEEKIKTGAEVSPLFRDIGVLYHDYMKARDLKSSPKEFDLLVQDIMKPKTVDELAAAFGTLQSFNMPTPIRVRPGAKKGTIVISALEKGPLSIAKSLDDRNRGRIIEKEFRVYYKKLLKMAQSSLSMTEVDQSLKLESQWASNLKKGSKDTEKSEPMTLASLKAQYPFPWEKFFKSSGIKTGASFIIESPAGLKSKLASMKGPLKPLLVNQLFRATDGLAPILSAPTRELHENFRKVAFNTKTNQAVVSGLLLVQGLLPDHLSMAYAAGFYWPDVQNKSEMVLKRAKRTLKDEINGSSTISPELRKILVKRLDDAKIVVGYSDKFKMKEIGLKKGEFLKNIFKIQRFRYMRTMSRKPQLPSVFQTWGTESVYISSKNTMYIPVGRLQFPFLAKVVKGKEWDYYEELSSLLWRDLVSLMVFNAKNKDSAELVKKQKKALDQLVGAVPPTLGKKGGGLPKLRLMSCMRSDACPI